MFTTDSQEITANPSLFPSSLVTTTLLNLGVLVVL
jgi:hypothetical protein